MASKVNSESHDQTLDGKLFQTVGAATEKARAASAVCVRGTVNSGASEDRSDLVGGRSCSRSARYGGDDASRVLNVKSAVLYRMRSLIGSLAANEETAITVWRQ